MATFNLAGALRGGKQPASQYGMMVDALSIAENRLKADGKASPGDYQALKGMAQKLYANPGFTPAERSNIAVKISQYDQLSKTTAFADAQDIARINREVSNEEKTLVYGFGNDPQIYLEGKTTVLEGKIFHLRENAYAQEQAGADSSDTLMELDKTQNELFDAYSALEASKKYKSGSPVQGFIANIETNSDGEIRDIVISKDVKSGHILTTGVLGGFSVAGKVDKRASVEKGKNVFKIGDTTFSAPSTLRPGPSGEFIPETLTPESGQTKFGPRGRTKAVGEFIDLDSQRIRPQRASRPGDWVQSRDGSFYKDIGNNKYERYVGSTKEQLRINDADILKNLPQDIFETVKKRTVKTNLAIPDMPSSPPGAVPAPVSGAPVSQPQPAGAYPSSSGPVQPTERAPQTSIGIAGQTLQKATGFLQRLFGK